MKPLKKTTEPGVGTIDFIIYLLLLPPNIQKKTNKKQALSGIIFLTSYDRALRIRLGFLFQ